MLVETRGNDGKKPSEVCFTEAILNPHASFGGLYAPQALPVLDNEMKSRLKGLSYIEFAKQIFALLKIELEEDILEESLKLYESFDNPHTPAPLVKIADDLQILELYHGPTRAFKDMALQPFGSILSHLAQKRGKEYLILAATSGDTGPATLESLSNKRNIRVICLYPHGGTSDVQRLQMTTQNAKNLKVLGIYGDFDDAQSTLKSLLNDEEFIDLLHHKGISLSAANSVNFGRIAFQIIYHAYASLNAPKTVDIIVPSGNFGNALGAFYAKLMGFDINKICIASNENNILTELITTGIYDIREKRLIKTSSPAMDILKSSNVERMLFALFGAKRTKELMESLEQRKYYKLTNDELLSIQEYFLALSCDDSQCANIIAQYAEKGYLLDPHTATGIKGYHALKNHDTLKIVCSTAEWTKFAPTVAGAIGAHDMSDIEALKFVRDHQEATIHHSISALFEKEEYHKEVINKETIKEDILSWLGS